MSKHSQSRTMERYNLELTYSDENRIMKLLNDINLRGTTVIVATHAKDIVDNMQKRVIEINKGVITRDDKRGGY